MHILYWKFIQRSILVYGLSNLYRKIQTNWSIFTIYIVKCILASICCLIYKMCRVFKLDCNRKLFLTLIIRARSCRCYLYLKKMAFSMLPKQLQFYCNDVDLVLCTYIHKYIYLIRYISYACISYEKSLHLTLTICCMKKAKVLNLISHIFWCIIEILKLHEVCDY